MESRFQQLQVEEDGSVSRRENGSTTLHWELQGTSQVCHITVLAVILLLSTGMQYYYIQLYSSYRQPQ